MRRAASFCSDFLKIPAPAIDARPTPRSETKRSPGCGYRRAALDENLCERSTYTALSVDDFGRDSFGADELGEILLLEAVRLQELSQDRSRRCRTERVALLFELLNERSEDLRERFLLRRQRVIRVQAFEDVDRTPAIFLSVNRDDERDRLHARDPAARDLGLDRGRYHHQGVAALC